MTIVEKQRPVIGGVDTHLQVHVAAVVDEVGGVLGVESFPTTEVGYARLVGWLGSFGPVGRVGVEGTGSYGAGLARHLARAALDVVATMALLGQRSNREPACWLQAGNSNVPMVTNGRRSRSCR